jgi:hypothetical protein
MPELQRHPTPNLLAITRADLEDLAELCDVRVGPRATLSNSTADACLAVWATVGQEAGLAVSRWRRALEVWSDACMMTEHEIPDAIWTADPAARA